MKAHFSDEPYHRAKGDEIVPLQIKKGTRLYVMAHPYILEPDYRLTVGLYPQPTEQGAIGEVVSSDWVGMRQRKIGQAQAWLYPEDRTLILWEALLENWCRAQDPRTDETLQAVWTGFEQFLLRQLPPIERIATPSWEPLYEEDPEAWPGFLQMLGYSRLSNMAFIKEVNRRPERQ